MTVLWIFPCSSIGKESACNAGNPGSILWLGRSPGEGNVNPLQYSCLENPMNWGAWQAIGHGVARVGHDLVTKPPPPVTVYAMNHVLQEGLGYLSGSDHKESDCIAWDPGIDPVATLYIILAWRIPWTEEPGRLQSMGSWELDRT